MNLYYTYLQIAFAHLNYIYIHVRKLLGLLLIAVALVVLQVPPQTISVKILLINSEYNSVIKQTATQQFTTSMHVSLQRLKSTLHTQQTKMTIVNATKVGMPLQCSNNKAVTSMHAPQLLSI